MFGSGSTAPSRLIPVLSSSQVGQLGRRSTPGSTVGIGVFRLGEHVAYRQQLPRQSGLFHSKSEGFRSGSFLGSHVCEKQASTQSNHVRPSTVQQSMHCCNVRDCLTHSSPSGGSTCAGCVLPPRCQAKPSGSWLPMDRELTYSYRLIPSTYPRGSRLVHRPR